ncbi:hypothetical protein CS542_06790 [Pedobacter sp. IW39]|nr:hypothetical protein CS542_06790 [Pedobacter sp. IW39]
MVDNRRSSISTASAEGTHAETSVHICRGGNQALILTPALEFPFSSVTIPRITIRSALACKPSFLDTKSFYQLYYKIESLFKEDFKASSMVASFVNGHHFPWPGQSYIRKHSLFVLDGL